MKRCVVASLFALALFAAGAAPAQTEKWNQEKVTALSAELVSSVSGLQNAFQNGNRAQNPFHTELAAYSGQVEITAFLSPPLGKAKATLTKLAAYYPHTP